jgi:hypothetical protein
VKTVKCFVAAVYFVKYSPFLTFLGMFAKFAKSDLASSCLSVRPHGTTWLPLDGF